MRRFVTSIPVKLCVSILLVESVLLGLMGFYYTNQFYDEIDQRVAEKLSRPAILMSEQALTYDSVEDLSVLSDLVQERVREAFVLKNDGTVFFTADPGKEGKPYRLLLDEKEGRLFAKNLSFTQQIEFVSEQGDRYLSILSPIIANDKILGSLYIKIYGEEIFREKRHVVALFLFGALLTVLLTTSLEALLVYRLVVPRIRHTAEVLRKVELGDLQARVDDTGSPDQLGELMLRVNAMLATIENYTRKLQVLNRAGEVFAETRSIDQVIGEANGIIERNLPVRRDDRVCTDCQPGQESITERSGTAFTIPVTDDEHSYQVMGYVGIEDNTHLDLVDRDFIAALSRMVSAAVDRITAFQDITEAEHKYRDLFVSAVEGIYRTTPDGRILEINPAMARMAGYDSVEEMMQGVSNLADQGYADPLERKKVTYLLQTQGKIHDYEVDLRRRDGSVFPASISAHAVRDEDGRLVAFDGRILNISERKMREQAERDHLAAEAVSKTKSKLVDDLEWKNRQLVEAMNELKSTQMQLMQSEKMAAVGMTAGGVAHDLNNILSGVVSYPDLLLAILPKDSEMRGPLETIQASGRRAAAIVADLLTLTQGTVRVKQSFQLNTLIEEYLQSVEFKQMMTGYPGIEIHTDFSQDSTQVHCSPVHIQKLVMNLVINAVEAITATGTVVISTAAVDAATTGTIGDTDVENSVILTIADDGPGIPSENVKHIFEPFYSRKVMGASGTGLGLTVVWNVVHEHGGQIDVKSSPKGTTFTVMLPAGEVNNEPQADEISRSVGFNGKGHILVIDDEPLQRDIAQKMLSKFGYTVDVCASGEEAITYLTDHQADLLVLDMLMPPGINGLETYRQILTFQPKQKAIIVSGYSENRDVKRAMQLGAGAFVKKPYTMNQIASAVKGELVTDSAAKNLQ